MSAASEITMSQGGTLTACATIGGTYVAIGGYKSAKWKGKRGTSNTSVLADTQARKKPKGIGDPGEISGMLQYGKTQFAALFTIFHAGTQQFYKMVDANGSVLGPFFAHFTDLELDFPEDDPINTPFTLDCSNEGNEGFTP